MSSYLPRWTAAAALGLVCGLEVSADIIIDDFTVGPAEFSVGPDAFPPPFVQTGLDPTRVLGGTRATEINGVKFGSGDAFARIEPGVDGGRFVYDTTATVPDPPNEFALLETMSVAAGDPDWADPASTFSADLTAGGNDRFEITFLETVFPDPQSPVHDFTLFIYSGPPGQRQESFELGFPVGESSLPQTFEVMFADDPGIDFTRIAYLELWTPNPTAGTVIALGSIRAVGGTLIGDYNGDGFVSQADLDLVLLNWGDATLPAGWAAGDQYDGVLISQNELDGVLLNWGDGNPPVASVIPEPGTAGWLVFGAAGWGRRTSRRRLSPKQIGG